MTNGEHGEVRWMRQVPGPGRMGMFWKYISEGMTYGYQERI